MGTKLMGAWHVRFQAFFMLSIMALAAVLQRLNCVRLSVA